jgi:hypothetical protein
MEREDHSFLPPDKNTTIDFSHGLDNGRLNLDKSYYESYLSSHILHGRSLEKLEARKRELAERETQLQDAQRQSLQLIEKIGQQSYLVPVKAGQTERLRSTMDHATTEKEQLRELRKKTRSDNAFIIGLLYVLAGGLFITGDLIISKDIVAYAFGFKGFEAWSFAGGLAALSLLLKPAYERLVEDYYHRGNTRRYVYFKIGLIAFALTTLAVLGLYRYEAYRVDKMKAFLNNEAAYLQSGANGASTALVKQLDRLRQQRIQLNEELLNDPWGVWSFVLTGILFAVSGAVSLGIGMPVVQTYWKRWVQIPIRTRKMARLERRTAVKLEKAEAELGQLQAQKQIGEAQLATLPDQAELREEIRGLQAEIRELTDQMALYEVDRRIAQYNDGYSRGTVQQESFASQQRSPGEVTVADDNLLRTTSQNGRNGKI